nr:sucrose-6-phosphate hydrolase [uncultured Trichococcus sp.]
MINQLGVTDEHYYTSYQEIPQQIKNEAIARADKSPFRQLFHTEAPSGYLNDPNGFSYFDGKYHLFYQWTPFKYQENPKLWYQAWHHLISEDLISWESLGPGIEPDTLFETHGAYSGSAWDNGDELLMFYTGNTRNEEWQRTPYQLLATMDRDGVIKKAETPAITGTVPGYTDHFRDPKIWKTEEGYFAVIGAQRTELTGAALVLYSENGTTSWRVLGEVGMDRHQDFGYMWECPDYFELDGKGILLFSPQGLPPQQNRFENIYQTGYLVGGRLDKTNLSLHEQGGFIELDRGFDIYATQTTALPDGRRILSGWMGLPEIAYPTEAYGYCGCLLLPRELRFEDGRLKQRPIRELAAYETEEKVLSVRLDPDANTHQLAIGFGHVLKLRCKNTAAGQLVLDLYSNEERTRYTRVLLDSDKGEVWLDREKSGLPVGEAYGTKRLLWQGDLSEIELALYLDRSSIELFLEDGLVVASSRIFPDESQQSVCFESLSGEWAVAGTHAKLDVQAKKG